MEQALVNSRSTRQKAELTPLHCGSRRIRGLDTEFMRQRRTSIGIEATTTTTLAAAATTAKWSLQKSRVRSPFYGGVLEDVEDWLLDFERVADLNTCNDVAKLRNVFSFLKDA